ncbi:MAG: hypothetical protein ACK5RL_17925 [Acidimicrobiales bacterium]
MWDGRRLTAGMLTATYQRVAAALPGVTVDPPMPELNHPVVIADELGRHLTEATATRSGGSEPPGRWSRFGRAWRLASLLAGHDRSVQSRYNTAVVHALHQLDHRTQLQDRVIAELEAQLAELRQQVTELRADRPSSPDPHPGR